MEGGGDLLPRSGRALLSVRNADKKRVLGVALELSAQNFELVATGGTCNVIQEEGIACIRVNKVAEGRPHIVDMIKNDEFKLIINTTDGKKAIADSSAIRRAALRHKVTYTTTMSGGEAICLALKESDSTNVVRLQDLHK